MSTYLLSFLPVLGARRLLSPRFCDKGVSTRVNQLKPIGLTRAKQRGTGITGVENKDDAVNKEKQHEG